MIPTSLVLNVGATMAQWLEDCLANLCVVGSKLAHTRVCVICFLKESPLGQMFQV